MHNVVTSGEGKRGKMVVHFAPNVAGSMSQLDRWDATNGEHNT